MSSLSVADVLPDPAGHRQVRARLREPLEALVLLDELPADLSGLAAPEKGPSLRSELKS